MRTNEDVIVAIHKYNRDYPTCKAGKKFLKYANWLLDPVFPVKIRIAHDGYFREDILFWNRILADFICEEFDFNMDYAKDILDIDFNSFEEMDKFHKILCKHFPCLKGKEEEQNFHNTMFGSGVMNELITEEEN